MAPPGRGLSRGVPVRLPRHPSPRAFGGRPEPPFQRSLRSLPPLLELRSAAKEKYPLESPSPSGPPFSGAFGSSDQGEAPLGTPGGPETASPAASPDRDWPRATRLGGMMLHAIERGDFTSRGFYGSPRRRGPWPCGRGARGSGLRRGPRPRPPIPRAGVRGEIPNRG